MPYRILKRDGTLHKWDVAKIQAAAEKALMSADVEDIAGRSEQVREKVLSRINGSKILSQETVQDHIEASLMSLELHEAAKHFILYREKRRQQREADNAYLNITETIDEYIGEEDWRVNENANMDFSFQGMVLHLSGSIQARYVLDQYPEEVRNAHMQGYIHIHDLSFGLTSYCSGWSLKDLLMEGFNLKGCCSSSPAKHLDSALVQVINFIGTLQNEFSGAQAFNSVDTYLAPFIHYDKLDYKTVKQNIQRFIYNLNTTSRWGGQTPFSNITLDLKCPKHIADQPVIIGGKPMDKTYGEFQEEMLMFNKAFVEVMTEGDADGRIFSFPIPTYNVTEDFPWETEVGEKIATMTAKYGTPYFQNFINSDLSPEDVQSMCCRLRIDKREVQRKTGGIFGAGDLTGSIGVVTLNLAKMGYIADDKQGFFDLVKHYSDIAKTSLELKRKWINANFKKGMYPWSRRYLKNGFKGHFSTIGVIGGNEACSNLLGVDLLADDGMDLMEETLTLIKDKTLNYQKKTGNLYNLEATPAEGASYRLATMDKKMHKGIIQCGNGERYYTNSTQLPAYSDLDPIEIIERQERLQVIYTGGTVQHVYLGEAVSSGKVVKDFVMNVFTKTKLPYISITPTFSICENHGYLSGEHTICPNCGEPADVMTRVVGYYRQTNRFNKGKKAEWKERVKFTLE